MITENIIVDNLKCGGCTNSIKQALKKIKGTTHVDVEVESSTVVIKHDGTKDKYDFLSLLGKMGYPEKGTSTAFQKAKSYVSCAVGKMTKQ